MNQYQLTEAQAARKAGIIAQMEMTIEAIQDGEIDLDDLDDLICESNPCTVDHAAYTLVMAIMGAQ